MNVWVIENFNGGGNQFLTNLWIFSHLLILNFLYLSTLNLKIIQHWKNTKFPKSHLTPLLMKMFNSYFIFNSDNCSTLFQILIIYALNDGLELEQCVRHAKWSSHHSIVSPPKGKANKISSISSDQISTDFYLVDSPIFWKPFFYAISAL